MAAAEAKAAAAEEAKAKAEEAAEAAAEAAEASARDGEIATASLEEAAAANDALEAAKAALEEQLSASKAEMEEGLAPLRERAAKLEEAEAAAAASERRSEEMAATLKKEQVLRKKLHNKLEDMKGAIRVFARGRPMSKSELERGTGDACDYLDPTSVRVSHGGKDVAGGATEDARDFVFDSVFGPDSTQEEVFEDTESLLDSVIDGFNVCVFAYGQTGSGKTFTMGGTPALPGLTPRCVSGLAERMREGREKGYRFQVKVFFVELYNDTLLDLLSKKQDKKLEIKQNAQKQVRYRKTVELNRTNPVQYNKLKVNRIFGDASPHMTTFSFAVDTLKY